ncbi:MAG: helicase-associated domain-containing protein [Treponema sp.]|nr:helicase-associated domain-containing protein [Treponema sp.]
MNNFRSIEFWKESIMTLPDNAFFDLLRSVFGKIKTPYNKQILAGDLEKFLLREDIQKNIACYIDDNDIRIIAAVAALGEPALKDLEIFFDGDLNYAELHDLVVNLEERLILYRFFEKGQDQRQGQRPGKGQGRGPGRLALNPALKSILSPLAEDKSMLFSSVSIDEVSQDEITRNKNKIFLDDRILAALLSFVSQNKLFFKAGGGEGGIRQKTLNAAESLFPGLPLETVIGALQVLGLFFAENETLVPDYRRFSAFGTLDRQGRLIYCAAGILCSLESKEIDAAVGFSPWLLRSRVHNYAEIINRLYSSIDTKRLYPSVTLRKLVYMMERADAANGGAANGGVINGGKIIEVMEEIGLIVSVSDKYWYKAPFTEISAPDSPLIAIDTPCTLLLYPEIAYNDAVAIAAFADIIEAGMAVRFEISRDSAVQAFDRGLTAAAIIELLQRLSHNRINENLSFTLCDWEKRHGEVTLRRGLILTLSPEQRHLAETKSLARFITETLAPGIYMLPESAEDRVVQALRKAGVAIIARRGEGGDNMLHDGESSTGSLRSFFLSLHAPLQAPLPAGAIPNGLQKNSSASILIESFHSILNKVRPKGEERDEMAARIDRRLILCESQLKDAVVRYEKLEARGLDYVGKALIAKQAISLQTPVEVIWPVKQKQERIFGIPKMLEKADSESILVIDPLDDGDVLRVPLGKISLLRRRRKSIFEE